MNNISSPHEQNVAHYYDTQTKPFYLDYWDEDDIHFGLFEPGETVDDLKVAIKRMTKTIAEPLKITQTDFVVDAGCGIGATAFDLINWYGCSVMGLTVSNYQVDMARSSATESGLQNKAKFEWADCSVHLPLDDNSVDAIISIESICHFSNRPVFFSECHRILKPGGYLAISDYTAQNSISTEDYETFIQPVCDAWFYPDLETGESHTKLLCNAGFDVLESVDFGESVLENAKILQQSYLMFLFQEAAGQKFPKDVKLWKRELKTKMDAWLKRHFTIYRLLARKNN